MGIPLSFGEREGNKVGKDGRKHGGARKEGREAERKKGEDRKKKLGRWEGGRKKPSWVYKGPVPREGKGHGHRMSGVSWTAKDRLKRGDPERRWT